MKRRVNEMTWTKEQIEYRKKMLATGLFKWERKNIYLLMNVGDFFKDIEAFNKKIEEYGLNLGHEPSAGCDNIFSFSIDGGFIDIQSNKENAKLVLKYKRNLRSWFTHDHYLLSDEFFDSLCKKLNTSQNGRGVASIRTDKIRGGSE